MKESVLATGRPGGGGGRDSLAVGRPRLPGKLHRAFQPGGLRRLDPSRRSRLCADASVRGPAVQCTVAPLAAAAAQRYGGERSPSVCKDRAGGREIGVSPYARAGSRRSRLGRRGGCGTTCAARGSAATSSPSRAALTRARPPPWWRSCASELSRSSARDRSGRGRAYSPTCAASPSGPTTRRPTGATCAARYSSLATWRPSSPAPRRGGARRYSPNR
mmetsp:Transcript_10444/g.33050  ORF Transcript_10444/g.33050 Transcript_10444/m.33050 type:complete len:218 (-) Transcript_10444:1081-1734(-)